MKTEEIIKLMSGLLEPGRRHFDGPEIVAFINLRDDAAQQYAKDEAAKKSPEVVQKIAENG